MASLSLPWVGLATAANASGVQNRARPAPDSGFVDARFPRAVALSRALHPGLEWVEVEGDVTGHRPVLGLVGARGTLRLAGITTESFPFCLEMLARERGATRLMQQRLDRDLLVWTLEVHRHG